MESSVGCHSTDVIGAWCHVKDATGVGSGAEVLVKKSCALIGSTTDYCPPSHSPALLYVSQIPDFDITLVAPTEKEICRTTVPTDHVDVALMRLLDACDILSPFTPYVPHAHALIC
jgi:hypothetical protein